MGCGLGSLVQGIPIRGLGWGCALLRGWGKSRIVSWVDLARGVIECLAQNLVLPDPSGEHELGVAPRHDHREEGEPCGLAAEKPCRQGMRFQVVDAHQRRPETPRVVLGAFGDGGMGFNFFRGIGLGARRGPCSPTLRHGARPGPEVTATALRHRDRDGSGRGRRRPLPILK